MQVPTYERQVTHRAVRPNPEAFGVGVAQAGQQAAQMTSGIGQLMQKRATEIQQEKDTQQVLEAETQMRKEINDLLHSQEMDENGRPVGILQRTLANADGATKDFDEKIEQVRQKYSGMFTKSDNQTNQFNQLYKNAYDSNLNMVVRHEAAQGRESRVKTLNDGILQKISDSAKNPDSLIDNAAIIKAEIEIIGDQLGWNEPTRKKYQRESLGKATAETVKILIDNNNIDKAKELFSEIKGELSGNDAGNIKKAIDSKAKLIEFDKTASKLINDYGEDLAKGHKWIQNQPMSVEDRNELTNTYNRKFNQMEQDKRSNENLRLDRGFQQITQVGNLTEAMNVINKMPNYTTDDYKIRQSLASIADQMYGVKSVDTDPAAWYELYDLIETGKISDRWQVLKQYGERISFGDMKSFWRAMDSMGEKESAYNKFGLASEGAKALKEAKIDDPALHGKFWDYISGLAEDFKKKNGRAPSSEEQGDIINQAITKTVVGRWKWGIFGGDKKDFQFQVPPNAKWSASLNAWVYPDEKGNWMKYEP